MLSKAKIKLIRSLEQKKYRNIHGLFVVEGDKMVKELLSSQLAVESLYARPVWLRQISESSLRSVSEVVEISEKELSQVSFTKTPSHSLALVRMPQYSLETSEIFEGLSIFLDRVQDPGNLGTIIRIADWFGIGRVLCGEGCADAFCPKSVQSTMGAIARVKIVNTDVSFFQQLKKRQPDFCIFGAFLEGESIYEASLSSKAVIALGNESKGISGIVGQYVDRHLLIPHYPYEGQPTTESLNVASAAAIICSEFRRR